MRNPPAIYVNDRSVLAAVGDTDVDGSPLVVHYEITDPPAGLPQASDDLLAVAADIGEIVRGNSPQGICVRVAIPAHWCFCQVIECENSGGCEETAAYAFEERIPVELERLTVAVQHIGSPYVLVVGGFTDALQSFLRKLEEYQVVVELLCVDAALGLEERSKGSRADSEPWEFCAGSDRVTLLEAAAASVPCVRTIRITGDMDHTRHHQVLTEALVGGPKSTEHLALQGAEPAAVDVTETAKRVLRRLQSDGAHLDLRRGVLAFAGRWRAVHGRLRRCALAAIAVFVVLAARYRWEAVSFSRAICNVQGIQGELYRSVFPVASAPAGAALRLRSERVRMQALTQTDGPDQAPRTQAGMVSFMILHELTSCAPSNVRLHVNEIDVDAEGIRVSGQTNNHAGAGDWVQEINRTRTLRADPPRTKLRRDGTVDFRIHAQKTEENDSP